MFAASQLQTTGDHEQKPALLTPSAANALGQRLLHLPSVGQWDWPGEPLTGTLAHALLDLEQPFCTTLDELLPKLLDETLTAEQLDDVLFGIREELRHVLYHVKDTKFFSHMLFDAEQPSRSAAASPIILRYPPVRVFANRLQREIGGPDV